MQYGYSPYGMPSSFPHPTAPGDPSTLCTDSSQVNLSFVFKLEFKLLNITQSLLLQGSQSNHAPMMSWGGSPTASQPSTWSQLLVAGFWPPLGAGFWRSPPPGQSSNTPPPKSGQGY
jgi:hypothetical protein